MSWLGSIPEMRVERRYGDRLVRCFAERPRSVNEMLAEAVTRNKDGDALACGAEALTYGTLERLVGTIAGGLAARGVRRGDRVALLLANSNEFVIALYAVMRLGAIAVPLNIREGARELAHVLNDCGALCIIHHADLGTSLPQPEVTPALRHRLSVGGAGARCDWQGMLDTAAAIPPAAMDEEEVAAILYTSGTTGRPKGAMITHMGLVHAAMIYEACMGLTGADRSVACVPLSHVTGLTAGIAAMLRATGTLIVMPTFKADAFIELAAQARMTHTVMVPAMYNLCLLQDRFADVDLSCWRIGGYGGAAMPEITIERLARKLPGLNLFNAYGSTETTGPVVLMPPREARGRSAAVGRAVPPAEILIMDEAGREVASGESGEIWLKGPNTVAGYWGNAEATTEGFVAGYWRSGDIGRLDADGFLTLLDRSKDLVNRGGYKIYSVEVENVLAAHPSVVEAAVVAKPCPVLGERVHAYVVTKDGFCDGEALCAHAASTLASYKAPESVTFLATALPRNANGKVLKRELRELLRAEAAC